MKSTSDWEVLLFSSRFVKQREYWINRLVNRTEPVEPVQWLGIKGKGAGTAESPGHNTTREIPIPGELSFQLLNFGKQSELAVYIVLLAVLKALIYRYSHHRDITVISPVYEDNIREETINHRVYIRDRVDESITFKEFLLAVKGSVLEAYENQDYPVEKIDEYLKENLELKDIEISNTVCRLTNIHDGDPGDIESDLVFSFSIEENRVKGRVIYRTARCEQELIEPVVKHFTRLLAVFIANPLVKISQADFLSAEEKHQLIFDFNETGKVYPGDQTLVRLFEERVEQHPDRIALVYEDRAVSYREFNRRANRLACLLRLRGVQSGSIVALMFERSLEMLIGIWAVLKAGGAYLPIDPELPLHRIDTICNDSGVTLLLTQGSAVERFSFPALQGLSMAGIPGDIRITSSRTRIMDLDDLPFPDRSLVDNEKYNRFIGQALLRNKISLLGSRGCPFKCAYCHNIWPKKQLVRSAENMFEELSLYYKAGYRRFIFLDDAFNLYAQNAMKLFRLIIQDKLDMQLSLVLRGDILTRDFIDLMVEAGVIRVAVALETASPRLQKLIGKNLNLEKFKENLHYMCETHPQLILVVNTMHGLPTETEEEALSTLELIKEFKWVDFPYLNVLKIYPNTEMEKIAINSGISRKAIEESASLAFHELPDTLPFDKSFSLRYQNKYMNEYFLLKERLLSVLPRQMKVLTEEDIIQKYDSYLPVDIKCFDDLLKAVGLTRAELGNIPFQDEKRFKPLNIDQEMRKIFPARTPARDALKILLLDLSQAFSSESHLLNVLVEAPIGLMYVLTYLNQRLGDKVNGKILKAFVDFNSYQELKSVLQEFKPDIIGIRTLTFYKNFFHKLAAMIRHWGIEVPIIAGGPYATSDYPSILSDRNIDLAVLGEGEITFAELVEKIIENNGGLPGDDVLERIDGIAFVPREKRARNNFAREILMVDMLEDRLSSQPVDNLPAGPKSSDLAYVIYTSGSIGQPKGVMIENRNVVNLAEALKETVYKTDHPGRRVDGLNISMVSPYYFDASIKQIFPSLTAGHTLHIVNEGTRLDGNALAGYYVRHSIDAADGTPTHLGMLLHAVAEMGDSVPRYFLIGGEELSPVLLEAFYKRYDKNSRLEVINAYGPTECCDVATAYTVDREQVNRLENIPIGRPLSNITVFLVDSLLEPVPIGAPGELFIGGAAVGRGYLNNPELTAEKFLSRFYRSSIFYRSSKSYRSYILYQTGDRGRWLADGNIEFLGRIDQQVKIRGCRIELEEIANHLRKHKEIKEAAVIVRDSAGSQADKCLCAYITADRELDRSKLREHLAKNLPDYMLPSYIVQIEKIPFTTNGKLDRKALPHPELTVGADYIAPDSELEKRMAGIWAEILGVEKEIIGIQTNFFEVGGDSLRATIAMSRIHKEFNVVIPLIELFRDPTIEGIAGYIREAARENFLSLEPVEKKEYYVLSSAQKRLYFLQQFELSATTYNMPQVVPLKGEVERKKLEECFEKLMARHESLRTSFVLVGDEPVQRIHEKVEFSVDYYILSSPRDFEKFVGDFLKPFDLSRSPLLRAGLIQTGQRQHSHLLLVDMHHIITDGISQEILRKEFMALYQGGELAPRRIHYKDFSEWQQSEEQKKSLQFQEEYWLKTFSDRLPVLNLPLDYPRPALQSFSGDVLNFALSEDEALGLKRLSEDSGATLHMTLLSIFTILLNKLGGQEDIIVGTHVAGRRHADLESVIGMFINALPVRLSLSDGLSFQELLAHVKTRTLEAYENQDFPFEELVEKVCLQRDTSRNPMFDAVCGLNNVVWTGDLNDPVGGGTAFPLAGTGDFNSESYEDIIATFTALASRTTKYDLVLTGTEAGNRLLLTFQYSTKLFKRETIERYGQYLEEIASSILENHTIRLEDISLSHDLLTPVTFVVQEEEGDFGF
jgi:amino acid adenylation domain-containing protein